MSIKKGMLRRWEDMPESRRKEISEKFLGENNPMFGKKRPDLSKRNRESIRSGENHWNWKGGISRGKHYGGKIVEWRKKVFKRDKYTCQTCGVVGGDLEAHHIRSFSKYKKLRYILSNGVTLCKKCHKKTDNWGGKKQ